jgi:hypothetical protein
MVLNRLPRRGINWLTPFEMVHGRRPDISGYRIIGSRAYVLIKTDNRQNAIHRQKLQKLRPKAVKGWLIGLAPSTGSNIYKIWFPDYGHRVVMARDVRIDEKIRYQPDNTTPPATQEAQLALAEIDIDDDAISDEFSRVIEALSIQTSSTTAAKLTGTVPSYPSPPASSQGVPMAPLEVDEYDDI